MAIINNGKTFLLNTADTSYAFCINPQGLLRHLYWGRRIVHLQDFEDIREPGDNGYYPRVDRTMEEFSSFGMMRYKETAMKLRFADGVRDFRYQVADTQIQDDMLTITLTDEHYPVKVELHYQVFEADNIIKKWCSVQNMGSEKIVLERLYSGVYGIPGNGYEIINYNGQWAAEFKRSSESLNGGKKVFESLRGSAAHVANPSFIVHKNASEDNGDVYYGALEYSGNFKVTAEATPYDYLNILIGISDTDFAWVLESGETFIAPAVYSGYSDAGFGKMSHTMHEFAINQLAPKVLAKKPLPVLYNSWYATIFDVQSKNQMNLADKAAAIGTELFVVDDGWFGERQDDFRALGDWYVNEEKFPNGLNELIGHVNHLGMDFGIWIEPEMVNKDSDLFRKHPDWAYQFPNREILEGRNQLVLNLTREDVLQFMIDFIDRLLSDHNIAYIKWDMNRAVGETSLDGEDIDEMKEVWVKHTQGFYRVIDAVRKKHPNVEFEACASGGGRVELGAMRYFDEYWPSDNVDALDRLEIQENYSLIYPIKYMRAWLIDPSEDKRKRQVPLEFHMHCAMCGSLGIGNDLNGLSQDQLDQIKELVVSYKDIREIVQFGRLYRLCNYKKDDIQAVQYVKENRTVLFVFLIHMKYDKEYYQVKLKGLHKECIYDVEIHGKHLKKSGAYLMNHGIEVKFAGDYSSHLISLVECQA